MKEVFDHLFVLEMANNHWGNVTRGKQIIDQFAGLARYHEIKVAFKLQFRDVDRFIQKDFKGRTDLRYIAKTEATKLRAEEYGELVEHIRSKGAIPMATPFDEASVELCEQFGFDIIKVASSDHNDWPLLEKIASLKKPVIVSTGGASLKAMDDLVLFFEHRDIPLALNHCVSLYPSEDSDLELSQITFLKNRYPNCTIGYSSHEQYDWRLSMAISLALGARTWERHIDIDADGITVSPYCTLPEQADEWFSSYRKSLEMLGNSEKSRRTISREETEYLDALVRGIYVRRPLKRGYVFDKSSFDNDLYLAVPLQKGQLSTREMINGLVLERDVDPDNPLLLEDIESKFLNSESLRNRILSRGL